MLLLLALIVTALVVVLTMTRGQLAVPNPEAKFRGMFSNNRSVNILAAARMFLFASRDVWFVVGVPVFMESVLGWSFWQTGAFLAVWVIGYGAVQASAPRTMRQVVGARRAGRDDGDVARVRPGDAARGDRDRTHRRPAPGADPRRRASSRSASCSR